MNRYIPAITLLVLFCGVTAASAQSAMPVENVQPDGTVAPPLALTPAERGALYNDVRQQRVYPQTHEVAASVGAPVSPSVGLPEVPDLSDVRALADGDGDFLKYATVEGDVVVVDPIRMRVVEVIRSGHSGVGP